MQLEQNVTLDPTASPCFCVKQHQPRLFLTERHHIMPLEFGGPDQPDNWVNLCPTGHYIVHYHFLQSWLSGLANQPPPRKRDENVYLYAVALEGWRRIKREPWNPISIPR